MTTYVKITKVALAPNATITKGITNSGRPGFTVPISMITYPIPEAAAATLSTINAPLVSTTDYRKLVVIATAIARTGAPLHTVERTVRKVALKRGLLSVVDHDKEHATDLALQAVCDACGATGRMSDFNADDWTQ